MLISNSGGASLQTALINAVLYDAFRKLPDKHNIRIFFIFFATLIT